MIIVTATFLGVNIWGSVLMRQEFNPMWFIPTSTYLSQFFSVVENYYPDNGQMATIYVKTENLSNHLHHVEHLISSLRNETSIVSRVDDWYDGFKEFAAKHHSVGKLLVLRIYFAVC